MRGNLIKKIITDKNGKRTTVWVNPNKDKSKDTNLSKLTKSYEKDILAATKNEYEMAIVIGEDSNVTLQKSGSKSQIAFNNIDMHRIKDAAVFTHNHPSSRCFSINDLAIAINSNIKQMRAIAPKSIKGNITWVFEKGKANKADLERFVNEYRQEDSKVYNIINNKILDNEITIDEANATHGYRILENMMTSIYWRSKEMKFYAEKRD